MIENFSMKIKKTFMYLFFYLNMPIFFSYADTNNKNFLFPKNIQSFHKKLNLKYLNNEEKIYVILIIFELLYLLKLLINNVYSETNQQKDIHNSKEIGITKNKIYQKNIINLITKINEPIKTSKKLEAI